MRCYRWVKSEFAARVVSRASSLEGHTQAA
jgi:hypothetical protein